MVADQKGAEEIVILDLRKFPTLTSYFVVMTALSAPHVRALSDAIEEAYPGVLHVERDRRDDWILMDYGELVVHIFQPEPRTFYSLDRLWGDAPQVSWGPKKTTKTTERTKTIKKTKKTKTIRTTGKKGKTKKIKVAKKRRKK